MLIFASVAWLVILILRVLYHLKHLDTIPFTLRHAIHIGLDLYLSADLMLWGLVDAGIIKGNTTVFAVVGLLYFVAMAILYYEKKKK